MTLNYNHLHYFYVIAKCGGVTAAAKKLNTSQSSLSSQLKTLEENLGRKLFQKNGRKLVLTQDGKVIYNQCQRVFEAASEISAYLRDTNETAVARISIGVSDEIDRPFITSVISRTLKNLKTKDRPKVRFISGSHSAISEAAIDGDVDILISTQLPHSSEIILMSEILLPVAFVCDRKHKTLGRINSIEQIIKSKIDLILPSAELRLRHETDDFIYDNKIQMKVVFEANVMATITQAILEGLGGGFIPTPYIREQILLRRLKVAGPKMAWKHKIFILSPKNQVDHNFAQALISEMETAAKT